ncbi:diaminopimelate epimerase [Balneicella halophila]|uniref:Diaminopimelate epimerase n=1 Tax=Balneicella halophila TaxID=1537566 RepID=A0A7L4UP92_BALHA|nr:diaminopimelate epimerase [Balneicella halophila]PVX50077.1 diaminopimelate epimerase [Balneicella halophila]
MTRKIFFYKYHGTGNDFILIDNRDFSFHIENNELIKHLCHRRFGIGADGLILLENTNKADFKMQYFNSDGNLSSMCGNGGRCIVAFAKYLGIIDNTTQFLAPDGMHSAELTPSGVALQMKDVSQIEQVGQDFYLDTGSPHYVKLIDSHENFDTVSEGQKIRYNNRFNKVGTNVNFVSVENNKIILSTYERGVEDETYSCGTGTVATAIVLGLLNGKEEQELHTKGGILKVSYTKKGEAFKNIILEGPVEQVFQGEILIKNRSKQL